MAAEKQRTLAGEAAFSGIGLHSGEKAAVRILPADVDTGIVLRAGGAEARLRPSLSAGEGNCNRVRFAPDSEAGAMTVEHLLAAIWGMGIDNAVIELDGPEAPGLDGSSLEYARGLEKAGIVEQAADRRVFVPKEAISVGNAASGMTAYPSPDGKFRVTYILDYPESSLARGTATLEVTPEAFMRDIAPARTFAMLSHVAAMQAAGRGKGASAANTLVLDGDKVVDNAFRLPDECVRHKILDVVGDLAILNRRLGVHIVASKSGHAMSIALAKAIERHMLKVENPAGLLDSKAIAALLPHRYPFLLLDKVLELENKRRIVAVKNLTFNESFFQGHFPGQPIMPGVLQIEALAQAGAIMMLGDFKGQGKLAVLMSAEDVKWRRQVVPGDCLHLHVEFMKLKSRIGVVKAWATVDGDVTTEAIIKFAIVDAVQPAK